MINGDLIPLGAWLTPGTVPESFARMFRAPAFDAEPELVR